MLKILQQTGGISVEMNRALQILGSSQEIDVVFEGESVWIDDLNPDTGTASIHSMNSGKLMKVEVGRLHEPQGYQ